MKYNTAVKAEKAEAFSYFTTLANQKKLIEIKRISPTRSLRQNRYLHLLIGAFGAHFGYTLEEAKQIYKELNAGTYSYRKNNRTFWRSSADLTTEEMTKTIDLFRERSAAQGCPLPTATDQGWLREIENIIEQNRYYI